MFTARLTESLGAPEGITSRFLIEQKVDLAACPEPLYLARERETGVRRWVKCSDGTEESLERLRNEAQILAGLSHPHLPVLQADASDADEPHLVFPWQAEVSLAKKELADLSAPDRARIAEGLVQVVSYLQAEKPPVSHNRMELDNFWVSPEILWPKLWGFGYAQAGAAVEQLRA
ncbi:protein kinase family protein, partial [bacterium]|nr:protein kinase family protein [bacterium]